MNPIEQLKSQERFAHAGALAFILGHDANYGCHYGMRSTRDRAMNEYCQGWQNASNDYYAR